MRILYPTAMHSTAVTVRVPATSANLGAGFDCLGIALDLTASITVTFNGHERPPTEDVGEKMVLSAIKTTYLRLGRPMPESVTARYTVAIPLGRGLGASAVARVAGVLAVNEFEQHPLTLEECMSIASDLEGHGDNACPATFGGFQVCVETQGKYLRVACKYPADIQVAILIPDHSMPTKEARKALPESYSKADTVHNTGRSALFVAAMAAGRLDALDEATNDRIHQPYRSSIFPPMYDIFTAAKAAGAHAAWLSGAGSSIAALCSGDSGRTVAAAMQERLTALGHTGRSLVTRIAAQGAEVAKVELLEL